MSAGHANGGAGVLTPTPPFSSVTELGHPQCLPARQRRVAHTAAAPPARSRAANPARAGRPSAPVRGRSPPLLLPEAFVLEPALAPAEALAEDPALAAWSESAEASFASSADEALPSSPSAEALASAPSAAPSAA